MMALVAIWGVNFPIIKGALRELPPLVFNGLRFLIAGALLGLMLRRLEGTRPLARADLPGLLFLGLLGHAGYQSLFMAGLARTTAGHSSLIIAMVPLFVGVVGVALGVERPSQRMWLGLVVAFAGTFILIRGRGPLSLNTGTLTGDLLTLAAICWAGYTVLSRPFLERFSPLRLATLTLLLGLPVITASAAPGLARLDWRAVGAGSWAALAYSAVFAVAIAYTIWYTSLQAIGSARTAAFSNLIPIVALLLARALLDEPMGPAQMADRLAAGLAALLGAPIGKRHRARRSRRARAGPGEGSGRGDRHCDATGRGRRPGRRPAASRSLDRESGQRGGGRGRVSGRLEDRKYRCQRAAEPRRAGRVSGDRTRAGAPHAGRGSRHLDDAGRARVGVPCVGRHAREAGRARLGEFPRGHKPSTDPRD